MVNTLPLLPPMTLSLWRDPDPLPEPLQLERFPPLTGNQEHFPLAGAGPSLAVPAGDPVSFWSQLASSPGVTGQEGLYWCYTRGCTNMFIRET